VEQPHSIQDECDEEDGFQPLTPEQAKAWRARHPPLSVWRIVWGQAAVAAVVALLAWCLTGRASTGWSAGYGGLVVVVPAALFARGMVRQRNHAGVALAAVVGWELVKIVLTVAMLVAAPKLVPQLQWPALLVGVIVTMKTYWVALVVQSSIRKT